MAGAKFGLCAFANSSAITSSAMTFLATLLMVFAGVHVACASGKPASRFVDVRVDAGATLRPLPPIWRFFGADEPNYALDGEGDRLLAELGSLRPSQVYFRAHNLMTTGDGVADFKWGSTNLYTERSGEPVYDFTISDRILDTYLARGIHPYLELGFMPAALSSAPVDVPYRRSWRPGADYKGITAGWSYPPRDFSRWADVIFQWTRHNVERYGRSEVERWYFETWNEANLDFYWTGTMEQFLKLHDYAIDAVRRALPTARVGGPDLAGSGGEFMDSFLRHVTTDTNYATGKVGTPTDFVSFHAKGQPQFVDGHVRMGIASQLRTADAAFSKIAAVPALAHLPIVIGENDPEGCAACPGPQNAYRNGELYASYTAASYARLWELAARRGVNLEGALAWSFTFVGTPWFAGYRQLATNGVDLAVLNVFRLFARLGNQQLHATSSAQIDLDTIMARGVEHAADVGVLASRTEDGLRILLWHYHDDDLSRTPVHVEVTVTGMGSLGHHARAWRVDHSHANAYAAWLKMGSPPQPSGVQVLELQHASQLKSTGLPLRVREGQTRFDRLLPVQSVELIEID